MFHTIQKTVYFYLLWIYVICRRIYKRCFVAVLPPPPPPPDLVLQYIERRTKDFLARDGGVLNTNMDAYFYNKDEYDKHTQQWDGEKQREKETAKWKRRVMMEASPINGSQVIVYYDPSKLAFLYYSDHHHFSYSLLNAFAMKYTTVFHCRDLFLDETVIQSPLLDALHEILYVFKKKPVKLVVVDDAAIGSAVISDDADVDIEKRKALETLEKHKHLFKKAKCHKPRQVVAEETIRNKFVYMGRIVDYFKLLPTKKPDKTETIQQTLFPELTAGNCSVDIGGVVGNDFTRGGDGADLFCEKAPLSWKDYKKKQQDEIDRLVKRQIKMDKLPICLE